MRKNLYKDNNKVKLRYATRKLSIGVVSIMIGMSVYFGGAALLEKMDLIPAVSAEETNGNFDVEVAKHNVKSIVLKNIPKEAEKIVVKGGKTLELVKNPEVDYFVVTGEFEERYKNKDNVADKFMLNDRNLSIDIRQLDKKLGKKIDVKVYGNGEMLSEKNDVQLNYENDGEIDKKKKDAKKIIDKLDLSSSEKSSAKKKIDASTSEGEINKIKEDYEKKANRLKNNKELDKYKDEIKNKVKKLNKLTKKQIDYFKDQIDLVKLSGNNSLEAGKIELRKIYRNAEKLNIKQSDSLWIKDIYDGDSEFIVKLPQSVNKNDTLKIELESGNVFEFKLTESQAKDREIEVKLGGKKVFEGNKIKLSLYSSKGMLKSEITVTVPEKDDDNDDWNKGDNEKSNDGTYISPKALKSDRISGKDRFATSIAASDRAFPSGARDVVLVNSDKYSDILGAMPYAESLKAPILYSKQDSTPKVILDQLKKLGAKNITVIGGESSFSESQVRALKSDGYDVKRIGGENRFDTSAKLAEEVIKGNPKKNMIIASSENFADALSISPLAFDKDAPILLVSDNGLSKEVKKIISKYKKDNTLFIVGGKASVSDSVERDLKELTDNTIRRYAGDDRYETSAKVARDVMPDAKNAIFANGDKYQDALVSGGLEKYFDAPILLVKEKSLPRSVENYIHSSKLEKAIIVGGTNSVSNKTEALIVNAK